jgi:hypothetical protein
LPQPLVDVVSFGNARLSEWARSFVDRRKLTILSSHIETKANSVRTSTLSFFSKCQFRSDHKSRPKSPGNKPSNEGQAARLTIFSRAALILVVSDLDKWESGSQRRARLQPCRKLVGAWRLQPLRYAFRDLQGKVISFALSRLQPNSKNFTGQTGPHLGKRESATGRN